MPLNSKENFLKRYITDIVYGANDGIITTFTIVSGAQGAQLSPSIVIILGLVNLIADGLSMGASSYLSLRVGQATQGLPSKYAEPMIHGLATFLAFVCLGAIPLVSYLIPGFQAHQFWVSSTLTGIALFLVGSLRVFVLRTGWIKGGFEMLSVGGVVAFIAYMVGHLSAELVGSAL